MMQPNIANEYQRQIQVLAEAHRRVDPSTVEIHLNPDPLGNVIRLLEVSRAIPNTGEVFPFQFAPAGEITYRSVVVLLSLEEWEQVKSGALRLPEGWNRENLLELYRQP